MGMAARVRLPSETRRPQIAAAALRLIGERGLPALTSAALAAEVGLTSGALFRHFPSVDAILDAAVEDAIARLEGTFPSPGLGPKERLFALVRSRIDLLAGDPGLAWLLRSDQAALALPPAAVERLGALVARSRAFLLDALREGRAEGSFRTDIAPETLLVFVLGAVHVLTGMAGVHRTAPARSPAKREDALRALDFLLAPPPGGTGSSHPDSSVPRR